ncbi:hypothetical protein THIX_40101 [Thiomonas sp. X19]|nr:hypothetical protein THIX_40101 [Thiomonas sp. X19]
MPGRCRSAARSGIRPGSGRRRQPGSLAAQPLAQLGNLAQPGAVAGTQALFEDLAQVLNGLQQGGVFVRGQHEGGWHGQVLHGALDVQRRPPA